MLCRLRELDVQGEATSFQSVAREVVCAAVVPVSMEGDSCMDAWEAGLDDEAALLALEEEIAEELRLQAQLRLEHETAEVETLMEAQNAEDCALFEQHVLGGVPCPLCGLGRLWSEAGSLLCTSCSSMRAVLVDEAMPMEDVAEMLFLAEQRHAGSGCSARPTFEVRGDHGGVPLLWLRCAACGWGEVAL